MTHLQHFRSGPKSPPLAFDQTGAGPDVILIHGAMSCLDDMAIALFASLESAFRVTAFDRPGHGQNADTSTGGPWKQAEAVHASATALGLGRPVVVGHSFGAAVALAYALRYPDEIAGVVALSPIAIPEPRLEQLLFAPRAVPGPVGFLSHSIGRLYDPILLPFLWHAMFLPQLMPASFATNFPFALAGRQGQLLAEGRDAALMAPGVAWNVAGYASCKVPVHILAGDRDLVVNTAIHADGLAGMLPQARLTKLHGLGHMIHHFAQPNIAAAIRELHVA
jgi:pimeloyl-ACP methyl ester carboxylesterase